MAEEAAKEFEGIQITNESFQECCTREELTELVRAIKFAKPDESIRSVHLEISQDLSKKEGFEFLKEVKLNDVKRVWKKAVSSAAQQQQEASVPEEKVMKLYTVGDGTVRTLAKGYSQTAAAQAAAAAAKEEKEQQAMMENYVHVFLDVPADRSGSRPHQALISFHDNHSTKSQTTGEAKVDDRGEIVKIQVAASADDTPYPMLMYNADRSHKTFIHPDPNDDGYQKMRNRILREGTGGALGSGGGSKAYFYSRITERKKGANVISIDVSELAPIQPW